MQGRVGNSFSTSVTRRVTEDKKPVISQEIGKKEAIVITNNGTNPWMMDGDS